MMKIIRLLTCFFYAVAAPTFAGSARAQAADMTLDFTWIGMPLCAAKANSPEFELQNVPQGTARLRFTLIGPAGGALVESDVTLPARGLVPRGTIAYQAPCVGGVYTWMVEALAENGARLASARLARPFY